MDRARIDLASFMPDLHPMLIDRSRVIVCGKHLCGRASDFALRGMVTRMRPASAQQISSNGRPLDQKPGSSSSASATTILEDGSPTGPSASASDVAPMMLTSLAAPAVRGLAIATCCHHWCSFDSFVRPEYFTKRGFDRKDFAFICRLSSWAVSFQPAATASTASGSISSVPVAPDSSSTSPPTTGDLTAAADAERIPTAQPNVNDDTKASGVKSERLNQGDSYEDHAACSASTSPALLSGSWTVEERIAVGDRCKFLLDSARCEYLRMHGYDPVLVRYCPRDITPERTLLLAVPSASTS